jgi:hypothetical protein
MPAVKFFARFDLDHISLILDEHKIVIAPLIQAHSTLSFLLTFSGLSVCRPERINHSVRGEQ